MHTHFQEKLLFDDDFPDMSYESQLNYAAKYITECMKIDHRPKKYNSRYIGSPVYAKLIDVNHADYFINFMFKFGKELNLKVTYEFRPQWLEIEFWFERQ
jgi:hypothetical protein